MFLFFKVIIWYQVSIFNLTSDIHDNSFKYSYLILIICKQKVCPGCELEGVWSTSLLPLLPGPLWPGTVVPVRVPSIDQIDVFKNY